MKYFIENGNVYERMISETYEGENYYGPEYRVSLTAGVKSWERFNIETGDYIPASEYTEPFPGEPTTLEEAKSAKTAELNAACRQAIEAGFSLLGHSFLYRESPDQNNMNTAAIGIMAGAIGVTDPITEIEWETEDAGKITFTASEFLQIFGYAEKVHKKPKLDRVFALKAQKEAAATMEEVASVVW